MNHVKRKTGIILMAVVCMISAGAALSFTGSGRAARPGQSTVIGHVNDTVPGNTSLNSISDNAAANITYETTTRVVNGTRHVDGTITATLLPGTDPGDYTYTAFFQYTNTSKSTSITYTVPRISNWTITSHQFKDAIAVGTRGVVGNISLRQQGNVDRRVSLSTHGNISRFLSVPDTVDLVQGDDTVVDVQYRVLPDTRFGYYTGNITASDVDGNTETVPISVRVEDRIKPVIESVEAGDTMATLPQKITVGVSDNYRMNAVSATVLQTVTVEQGNDTVQVNRSVAAFNLSEEQVGAWTGTFTDTSEQGRYYLEVAATDAAGNNATATTTFHINRLDVVNVEHTNFRLPTVKPDRAGVDGVTEAEKTIVTVDEPTNVTFTLTGLSKTEKNTSVTVGIRRNNKDVPTTFNGVNDTVSFNKPGTYRLVVTATGEQSYRGTIRVGVVPQHVSVPQIRFRGEIINPEYPEPACFELSGFNGCINYTEEGSVDRPVVRYTGTRTVEDCKGLDNWKNCASGFALGALTEVKHNNAVLRRRAAHLQFALAVVVLLAAAGVVYVRRPPLLSVDPVPVSELKVWNKHTHGDEVED